MRPVLVELCLLLFVFRWESVSARKQVEVDGVVRVYHHVNVKSIRDHLELWKNDTSGDDVQSKLLKYLALQKIREVGGLLARVIDMVDPFVHRYNHAVVNQLSGLSTTRLQGKRKKRNVFGDIVHAITGLPTEEQLSKEVALTEALRQKVLQVVKHELDFEKDTATVVGRIERNEVLLGERLSDIETRVTKSMKLLSRHIAFASVVETDKMEIEEVLYARLSGRASVKMSMELAKGAGLSGVPEFKYLESVAGEKGIETLFLGTLYAPFENLGEEIRNNDSMVMSTERRKYLMSRKKETEEVLSEWEVRIQCIVYCIYCIKAHCSIF